MFDFDNFNWAMFATFIIGYVVGRVNGWLMNRTKGDN